MLFSPRPRQQSSTITFLKRGTATQQALAQEMHETGVRLDWKRYREKFVARHGEPMPLSPTLFLFPDGWQWDEKDGRETPPPADMVARQKLLMQYLTLAIDLAEERRDQLLEFIVELREVQSGRSLPLEFKGGGVRQLAEERHDLDRQLKDLYRQRMEARTAEGFARLEQQDLAERRNAEAIANVERVLNKLNLAPLPEGVS